MAVELIDTTGVQEKIDVQTVKTQLHEVLARIRARIGPRQLHAPRTGTTCPYPDPPDPPHHPESLLYRARGSEVIVLNVSSQSVTYCPAHITPKIAIEVESVDIFEAKVRHEMEARGCLIKRQSLDDVMPVDVVLEHALDARASSDLESFFLEHPRCESFGYSASHAHTVNEDGGGARAGPTHLFFIA